MWQEVTKRQLQRRQILWACVEQLFQFLLHLLMAKPVRLMKREKTRKMVPAQSIFATTWPCSTSRLSSLRPSLLPQCHQDHYPPRHPQPIYVVWPSVLDRSPLTGQYVHQCISTTASLLLHFKLLACSTELYDNTPASADSKHQLFPQVPLREQSIFTLKQWENPFCKRVRWSLLDFKLQFALSHVKLIKFRYRWSIHLTLTLH